MLADAADEEQQVEQARPRPGRRVNRPRTADSNRSRAIVVRMPGALEKPGHRARVPLLGALRRPRRLDRHAAWPCGRAWPARGRCVRIGERADLGDEAACSAVSGPRRRAGGRRRPRSCRSTRRPRAPARRSRRARAPASRRRDRPACRRAGGRSRCARRRGRAPRARRPTCPAWRQAPRGGEPGVSGADDTDVRIDPLGHRPSHSGYLSHRSFRGTSRAGRRASAPPSR